MKSNYIRAKCFTDKAWGLWPILLIGAVVIALWFLWGLWGAGFVKDKLCTSGVDCEALGQVGDVFGGINALFAGLAFAGLIFSINSAGRASELERELSRDKEFVDQVCKSYQWAYEALTVGDPKEDPNPIDGTPPRSRVSWLSSARHLLRAEKIAQQIASETYRTIQREHKEYWQMRFYQATQSLEILQPSYYEFVNKDGVETPIEYRSALVIANFMAWTSETVDEMDSENVQAIIYGNSWRSNRLGRGVEAYIVTKLPKIAAEMKRRGQRS